METSLQKSQRIAAIDIMRGLTLFLMLFVNDLYEPGVPHWLVHTKASVDGMGLADWVFPGFLFMVGMAIPFAIRSRLQKGDSRLTILWHIFLRTASLLLIGVLMMNAERLNPELSGINKDLWAILMYLSVFLIWIQYPPSEKFGKVFKGLKLLGILGLIGLALVFRAGEPGHISWLETGWWGILGLIGWGYLVAASAFLFLGDKTLPTFLLWLFFVVLNILSMTGCLKGLIVLQPIFGVILSGNVPSIVLAGMTISLLLKNSNLKLPHTAYLIFGLGVIALCFGFVLRHWFIISKIMGTPSWGMVCNGISMVVFSLLMLLVDFHGKDKWFGIFKTPGQHSLTTYLAPDVIYFISWGLSLPIFFYKQTGNMVLAVVGSLIWALAMILFSGILVKRNIRLKL